MELANGCLCCSVKTEFVQALEALMQRRSRFDYILIETTGALPGVCAGAQVAAVQPALRSLSHVSFTFRSQGVRSQPHASAILAIKVIHCCSAASAGLADPGPVAAALWADDELEAAVGLDGVVTVADARNLARQLDAAREPGAVNEAARQLAYADVVLLNKARRAALGYC